MAISNWPASERPRERLLERGAKVLNDAELLAIFLRTGVKGKSAVELARDLLNEFGDLRQLTRADQKTFCKMNGLGQAKYVQLQACMEMASRVLRESLVRDGPLNSPAAAERFFSARMRDYTKEVFACLFLDVKNHVIQFEELFAGTLNTTEVHPREVVKRALAYNAQAVIFAHNHPSGDSKPSNADIDITRTLRDALALVDVKVLDHLVIGNTVQSLAELGHL